MLHLSYINPQTMQSEAEKRQTNRDITKRFVAVMYQCIGNQRVRTKKEFGEYAGVASSNLNRMENEETMNVPLYAIKNVHEVFGVSLEYIITGKGKMFA